MEYSPALYYSAARTCRGLAIDLTSSGMKFISEAHACRGMAGSDQTGTEWAAQFDPKFADAVSTTNELANAVAHYAEALWQAGRNWEIAAWNGHPQPRPALPNAPATVAHYVNPCWSTLGVAGGPGNGLTDTGLDLARQVGIPVPDGNTDLLKRMQSAAVGLALCLDNDVQRLSTVTPPAEPGQPRLPHLPHHPATPVLDKVRAEFASVPNNAEANAVATELTNLRDAAKDAAAAFADLAAMTRDHSADLLALRKQAINKILDDLEKELATELIITIAVAVITVGVGGILKATNAAVRITAAATAIRGAVESWRVAKKARDAARTFRDLAKARRTANTVKNRPIKKVEPDEPEPTRPKPAPAREVPTPAEAQKTIEQAERVGSGTKNDPWHRSASFPVSDIGTKGTVFKITGGDGVSRTLVQMPGEVNGIAGRFEWIVDAGKVTHQMFVRGGTINGAPIKP